jgi:hypothetical protein
MFRLIALLFGFACLQGCVDAPPVQEMSDARQAIVAARAAGAAGTNSSDMFAAEAAIERAEQHLQAHEYTRARLAAMQAKRHAGAALLAVQQGGTHNDAAPRAVSGDADPAPLPPPH